MSLQIWNIRVNKYKCATKPKLRAVLLYNEGNYNTSDVKTKRKYFNSKVEAHRAAEELKTLAESISINKSVLTPGAAEEYKEAYQILASSKLSITEACNAYMQVHRFLQSRGLSLEEILLHLNTSIVGAEAIGISLAADRYLNYLICTDKTKTHTDKVKQRLNRFVKDLGTDTRLDSLTLKGISRWLNNLKVKEYSENAKGKKLRKESNLFLSPKTKDNYCRCLDAFFAYCVREEYINKNPMDNIAPINVKQSEPEIYTVPETSAWLKSTKELSPLRLYVAIGMFTGIRCAEMHRLTWGQIHLKDREIALSSAITKTNRRRMVDISENLAVWLEPYLNKKPDASSLILPPNTVMRRLREKFVEKKKIKFLNNGFRHTSASYYLGLHKDANQTSLRMGHSTAVLEQNYKGLVRYEDAVKFWNIYPPEYKGSIPTSKPTIKWGI